jgi:pyruvate/2-oxoglutarate dehydrogenase complex dihydrolipoamide acyltransferase (E2) component
MTERYVGEQVFSYPNIRRWTAAAYRSVQRKPMLHGLLEVDVTRARAILRAHKARTGETLSFTAFLIGCLGKAVDEHKSVQAMRWGASHIVVFDDVDVYTPVEHELAGQKQIYPHIVRAANRKTYREIHDEIREAQVVDIANVVKGPRFLPAALYGLAIWFFWLAGTMWPQLVKRSVGTVGLTAVGMFGRGAGWGVPCPPPTALMITVGGIGERRAVIDGQTTVQEYLCLTVSVDHDIVDGAPAARFTARLKELIESGHGLHGSMLESERHRMAAATFGHSSGYDPTTMRIAPIQS